MKANDFQVDGDHYKGGPHGKYEHWDYALDAGLGVLEYAATKHLGRYHKKGEALNDIKKARHYVVKLLENVTTVMLLCPRDRFNQNYLIEVANRFIIANDVPGDGADDAIVLLTTWETREDLENVLENINDLQQLVEQMPEEPLPANPVPLEDSNKHALQQDDPE